MQSLLNSDTQRIKVHRLQLESKRNSSLGSYMGLSFIIVYDSITIILSAIASIKIRSFIKSKCL